MRETILSLLLTAACATADGGESGQPRQLTSDPHQDGYAAWSPDGRFVVYTSVREGMERLWKVPAEGGSPVPVMEYRSHHARFSPDGAYIAFDGEDGTLVQIMPSAGGIPLRVVPESIPIEKSGNPCWSPDGTRIAFHSEYKLWSVHLPTGRTSVMFQREGDVPLPVHWLKKGNCIVTALFNREDKKADLWKISVDSRDAQQLTFLGDVMHARVSPDESLLVFSSRTSGNGDLWVMSVDGGKPVRLTSDPSHEFEAC